MNARDVVARETGLQPLIGGKTRAPCPTGRLEALALQRVPALATDATRLQEMARCQPACVNDRAEERTHQQTDAEAAGPGARFGAADVA